jgi:hypothetical protein
VSLLAENARISWPSYSARPGWLPLAWPVLMSGVQCWPSVEEVMSRSLDWVWATPIFSRHSYSIWPLTRIKRLAGFLRMELLATNDHVNLRMRMHWRDTRYSA